MLSGKRIRRAGTSARNSVRVKMRQWRGGREKVLQRFFFLFSLGDIYERDPVRSTLPLVIHSLSFKEKTKEGDRWRCFNWSIQERERVFFSPFGRRRRRRSGRLYILFADKLFFWWRLLLVCCRTLGASFPLDEKHITSQHCSYRKRNRNVRGYNEENRKGGETEIGRL